MPTYLLAGMDANLSPTMVLGPKDECKDLRICQCGCLTEAILLVLGAVKRTYVEVTISSTKPDASRMALQSAAQYGALAASLKSAGIQFDSVGEKYATSPAPAPGASPTAAGSTSGDDDGSGSGTNVGAIVGGVVGGVAGLALAAATIFLVSFIFRVGWPLLCLAGPYAPSLHSAVVPLWLQVAFLACFWAAVAK